MRLLKLNLTGVLLMKKLYVFGILVLLVSAVVPGCNCKKSSPEEQKAVEQVKSEVVKQEEPKSDGQERPRMDAPPATASSEDAMIQKTSVIADNVEVTTDTEASPEPMTLDTTDGAEIEITDPAGVYRQLIKEIRNSGISEEGGPLTITLSDNSVVEVADAKASLKKVWSRVSQGGGPQNISNVQMKRSDGKPISQEDLDTTFDAIWKVLIQTKEATQTPEPVQETPAEAPVVQPH
jgi:hypothetical protein